MSVLNRFERTLRSANATREVRNLLVHPMEVDPALKRTVGPFGHDMNTVPIFAFHSAEDFLQQVLMSAGAFFTSDIALPFQPP
jgi:hypothetical protein